MSLWWKHHAGVATPSHPLSVLYIHINGEQHE